uniref:Gag-pol polyprotein n=1 Tax=Panagrolaimus sp. ES5 TaxID=591445 RepID=A0AC34GAN7_9BILA
MTVPTAPTTTSTASSAPVMFPQLPAFVPDPSNPQRASTWLKQVEMKFKISSGLTAEHKIALVSSALDSDTFARVARALPSDIATFADWDKFQTVFIALFDTKQSLFANRYKAFQIEWLGPARESWQEYAARVRETATLFDSANFSDNELQTLLLLMGMKATALEPLRSLVLNSLIKNAKEKLDNIITLVDNALLTERDQKLPEQTRVSYVKKTDPRPQRSTSPTPSDSSRISSSSASSSKRGVCKKPVKKSVPSKATRSGNKVGYVQIASCTTANSSVSRVYADILIDDEPLRIQYDSGSDITILSRCDHRKIGSPLLIKSNVRALGLTSKPMILDGCFTAAIRYMNSCKALQIHVADIADSLLGLDYCNHITLLPSTPSETFAAKVSSCYTSASVPTSTTIPATSSSTITSATYATPSAR